MRVFIHSSCILKHYRIRPVQLVVVTYFMIITIIILVTTSVIRTRYVGRLARSISDREDMGLSPAGRGRSRTNRGPVAGFAPWAILNSPSFRGR